MPAPRRRQLLGLGAAALLGGAWAPSRPVRLVVPFPPGGTTDVQMRMLAEKAQGFLGQPVVVENRSGAGGILGAQALTMERPDGHFLSTMPEMVFRHPVLAAKPLFEPIRDFTWLIQLLGRAAVLVVRADAPWPDFRALLAAARAAPGRITYGTSGVGSTSHLVIERLAAEAGVELTHVPFRGIAESWTALVSGQIHAIADAGGGAQVAGDPTLRLLASMGPERSRKFPNVPTLREQGIDVVATNGYGIAGPRGLPPEVVETLHAAFKAALFHPDHLALLERYDMQPAWLGPADYAAAAARLTEQNRALAQRLRAEQ